MACTSEISSVLYPTGSSTRYPGCTLKNFASNIRVVFVRCGRVPLSICERYDWLKALPNSFLMARVISCCVMARPKPRRLPSTSLTYRIFSPSFILQFVMLILQTAMCKGQGLYWACFQWIEPETLDIHRLQRNSKYHLGYGDTVHRATDLPASAEESARCRGIGDRGVVRNVGDFRTPDR